MNYTTKSAASFFALALLLLFPLAAPVHSQTTNSYQVQIASPPPPTTQGGVIVVGAPGLSNIYYWVIANFTSGSTISPIITATNSVGLPNLTGSNYVTVQWNRLAGAVSYTVVHAATPSLPSSCSNCAVVVNTTALTVNDTSPTGSTFTVPSVAPPGLATLTVDSLDETNPFMNLQLNGNLYRIAPLNGPYTVGHCVVFGAFGTLADSGSTGCGEGGGPTTIDAAAIQKAQVATVTSSSGSAYIAATTQAAASLNAGQVYWWTPNLTNTSTTPSLNIDGLGAHTLVHGGDLSALLVGELDTSRPCMIFYTGSNYALMPGLCSTGPGFVSFQHIAAASVPTPSSGVLNMFFNTSNSDHLSVKDSTGTVTDIQAGGGSGPFVYSAGVVSVAQTGSAVALYSTGSIVPALAAGHCIDITVQISQNGVATYTSDLYVDNNLIVNLIASTDWTGFLTNNHFMYCNNAGVQNAQTVSEAGGSFYCQTSCLTKGSNLSQPFNWVGFATAVTGVNWSTGGHKIEIRTTQTSGTITANFFKVEEL